MSGAQVLFDAPGPKGRVRNAILGVVAIVIAVAAVAVVAWLARSQLGSEKWLPFLTADAWLYYIVPGLINTLQAAAISVVISMILGLVLGMAMLSTITPVRIICIVLVQFFRAIPVLILMVFFYPMFLFSGLVSGPTLSLSAVVCGLVVYNSAVIAELVRSGVRSLPAGQREAGLMVGLTEGQTLRTILLPQAITAMLPALLSQLVVILKDTALGSIVTYPELLQSLKTFSTGQGNLIAALLVGVAIMIVLNWGLTSAAEALQRRLSRGSRTRTAGPNCRRRRRRWRRSDRCRRWCRRRRRQLAFSSHEFGRLTRLRWVLPQRRHPPLACTH